LKSDGPDRTKKAQKIGVKKIGVKNQKFG